MAECWPPADRGPGPCCDCSDLNEREAGPARLIDATVDVFPFSGKSVMTFTDRVLKCVDCGSDFVFTAGEQLFFHEKQFQNDPKRCKKCKAKRGASGSRVRTETRTTCSDCGEETTVPFKPTQGRPVLCRACFDRQVKQGPPAVQAAPEGEPAPEPEPEAAIIAPTC